MGAREEDAGNDGLGVTLSGHHDLSVVLRSVPRFGTEQRSLGSTLRPGDKRE